MGSFSAQVLVPVTTSLATCGLVFLASAAFTLATFIEPRTESWSRRGQADGLMQRVFGEGRRLFANHFFVQADVYFHSGYYPSIFDQQAKSKDDSHLRKADKPEAQHSEPGHFHDEHCDHSADELHKHDEHCDHSGEDGSVDVESEHFRQMALEKPRDWIEAFGRRFKVTTHKHLSGGNEREMLPWLKLSAEMDPQRIDTYTVAAYWLQNIGRDKEAEDFLRLGLRNNPDSYEILTELAQLLETTRKDDFRAGNLLRLAFLKWQFHERGKEKPDYLGLDKILVRLARIEERAGNKPMAIEYLKQAMKISPAPEALQKQIDQLRQQ